MKNQMGYIYAMISVLTNCIGGLLIKSISQVPSFQVTFYRSLYLTMINTSLMKSYNVEYYADTAPINRQLQFRGCVGFFGVATHFYGIVLLPLSEGTVLTLTAPVITGILAKFILNESYDLMQ